MTRAQYQAQFGSAPPPPPTQSQAPVQMTRAQYQAQFGSAPPPPPTQGSQNQPTSNIPPGYTLSSAGVPIGGNLSSNLARLPGDIEGAGNALLPAIGDVFNDVTGKNKKTALQQVGDFGSTALTVASVLQPELGVGDLGLGAKLGANAALGAGFGASGALGAGDTNAGQVATQAGVGAAGGGLLGGIAGAIGNKAAETGESRLTELTQKLKTLSKSFADNSTAATNPIKTLVDTATEDGKPLIQGLSTPGGRVNVESLTNENGTGSVDNFIESHAQQVSHLVKSLPGPGIAADDFKTAVADALKSDPTIRGTLTLPKALATLDSKMTSAEMSYGKTLPWAAIDEIRQGMNKVYDPDERDVARVIGDTTRALLKQGSPGRSAIGAALDNESELIKARNFLQKIQGTRVGKGQLGTYFSKLIGGGAGAAIGSIGGPIGEAAGTLGGAYTADAIENAIAGHYFNPIGSGAARVAKGLLTSPVVGAVRAGLLRGATSLSSRL